MGRGRAQTKNTDGQSVSRAGKLFRCLAGTNLVRFIGICFSVDTRCTKQD